MAFFMAVFIIAAIAAIIFSELGRKKEHKNLQQYGILLILIQIYAFIVAILLRDPFLTEFGIPADAEWFGELLLVGFTSWRYYFNPLKERVTGLEKTQEGIRSDIRHMSENITEIKDDVKKIRKK